MLEGLANLEMNLSDKFDRNIFEVKTTLEKGLLQDNQKPENIHGSTSTEFFGKKIMIFF